MNIVVGDYNINIKQTNILNRLNTLEYYKEIPDLFLETYTDLSFDDIDEIISNSDLSNAMVELIYNNLNVSSESKFIKTVNNSLELLNSVDGVLLVFLERYYEYNAVDLIKLTSEELLSLFIFCLKSKDAIAPIDIDNLKEILNSFYSEETTNDFIEHCCGRVMQQAQDSFEKEMEQLNNI